MHSICWPCFKQMTLVTCKYSDGNRNTWCCFKYMYIYQVSVVFGYVLDIKLVRCKYAVVVSSGVCLNGLLLLLLFEKVI